MRISLLLTMVVLLALAVAPGNAAVLTYNFTSDHCSSGVSPGGCSSNGSLSPMGTVTLTDLGANTVEVTVKLNPGFGFVSTGAGAGSAFFFDMANTNTITITSLTTGWSIPNVIGANQQAAGSYAGDGLMGQYNHGVSCNPPGAPTGCGNGGSSPFFGTLDFDVSVAGLTASNFAVSPYFAADVISSNGNTGLIDASPAGTTVPEPTSIFLLGSALVGITALWRKKVRPTA